MHWIYIGLLQVFKIDGGLFPRVDLSLKLYFSCLFYLSTDGWFGVVLSQIACGHVTSQCVTLKN